MKKVPIRVLGTIFLLALIAVYLLIQQIGSMIISPKDLNIVIPKGETESNSVIVGSLETDHLSASIIELQFCLTFDNEIN